MLVSRTNDDLPLTPVCGVKTSPCERSKRPRVYRHHAYMFQHMCAWCRHTGGRFECTQGGVLEAKYGFFPRFSSVPQHTHTPNTHHDHPPRPPNNTTTTTTHTTQHNTQHHTETERERERQREKERETEKERQRKRDRERETGEEKSEERRRKTREEMRGD